MDRKYQGEKQLLTLVVNPSRLEERGTYDTIFWLTWEPNMFETRKPPPPSLPLNQAITKRLKAQIPINHNSQVQSNYIAHAIKPIYSPYKLHRKSKPGPSPCNGPCYKWDLGDP